MYYKENETPIDNLPIQIYVTGIETRITFKIKPGNYLKLLTIETMKLLGSTEKTITNAPHLEITEVLLVHCNVVHNNYKQDSRVVCKFLSILLVIIPLTHLNFKKKKQVRQVTMTQKLLE